MITFNSIEDLRQALVAAKDAHTEYEKQNGPDENWPLWYARFIAERPQLKQIEEHFDVPTKKIDHRANPADFLFRPINSDGIGPLFLGYPAGKE